MQASCSFRRRPGSSSPTSAGRSHLGGGSHGSLEAGDSEVPILTVGIEGEPRRIVDLAPLALSHFGIEPPAYARRLPDAA